MPTATCAVAGTVIAAGIATRSSASNANLRILIESLSDPVLRIHHTCDGLEKPKSFKSVGATCRLQQTLYCIRWKFGRNVAVCLTAFVEAFYGR
jgi:hypothetical protein